MLKTLTLLRDRVEDWAAYPFTVPAIRSLQGLTFTARVCLFTGENGSGKSTLLEAIAAHYGFGREGGNRNFKHSSTAQNHSVDALVRALRLSFNQKNGRGFFLRAESFFNVATYLEEAGIIKAYGGYGGVELHEQSHGESFLALLQNKFRGDGLFLLDEPEAALSPQRQLAFLLLLHETLKDHQDAQFIISTHSPILLGFPKAQIVSFDNGALHPLTFEETSPAQIVGSFLRHRTAVLDELFREDPPLFPEE